MKKFLTTIACIILLMLLPGCWNRRELNALSIVQAIGIDRTEEGQIMMSLQILKPNAIKSSASEKEAGSKSVWVVTSEGETVFDALRNASLQTDRKAYFPHNTVYILSEEIAREGIGDELDLLGRDPEFRKLPYVFITKTKAEDIIRSGHEQEKIPGQAIEKMAELTFAASKVPKIKLLDLLKNLASKTNDSIIAGITLVQGDSESSMKLEGTAVLKRDKMIGWFDGKETRGVLWILGDVKSGIIVVPTPDNKTKKSSIEIIKASSNIVSERVDGKLEITVNVHADGNLGEQMGNENLVNAKNFKELEQTMASAIEEEIKSAVDKAQEWQVDIFKFGTEVHRQLPKEWPELEKTWRQELSKVKVHVVVDTNLNWAGLMKKSIQPLENKGGENK